MPKLVVASYCTTFLKSEMLHIYRQVTALRDVQTFVMTKKLQNQERFPFDDIELIPKPRTNPVPARLAEVCRTTGRRSFTAANIRRSRNCWSGAGRT